MDKKRVILGLSGGVDSAVAALILKKQGYEVIGAFMKNFSETKNKLTGECSWLEDKRMAQKVAYHLGIQFIMFDFEKQYKEKVIKPMIEDYKKGLTPNPDALCNKIIKFPLFLKEAEKLRADYIAMGHYIKKIKKGDNYELHLAKDKNKDQSYFLWQINQKILKKTLFPIGDYTKEEVREIAKKNNLPNAERKSTVGICFVGKVNLVSFLEKKIKSKKGEIKNPEGEIIGEHNGIAYYTIGQRVINNKEIKVFDKYRNKYREKLYIADKNKRKNILIVSPKNKSPFKKKKFTIIKSNFINKINFPIKAKVRIRHLGKMHLCQITKEKNKLTCHLKTPLGDIASGQSAVFYKNSKILGGGEIRT